MTQVLIIFGWCYGKSVQSYAPNMFIVSNNYTFSKSFKYNMYLLKIINPWY